MLNDYVIENKVNFSKIDKNTKATMTNLFGQSTTARLVRSSKQTGGTDCGLFAIANATALASKVNPTEIMFDQSTLRQCTLSHIPIFPLSWQKH